MICKKMLLSFVYLCFVLSTKEERALNEKENPKKEDQVFEDNSTVHIIFQNSPDDIKRCAIHHDPRLQPFFEVSREFLINSYNETTAEALKNLKTNIKKSKNKFYKEYDIYEMYYKECLEIFRCKILGFYEGLLQLNYHQKFPIEEMSISLKFSLSGEYSISKLKDVKKWDGSKLDSKRKMSQIIGLFKDISENEKLEQFLFSQLTLFYDCFFSAKDQSRRNFLTISNILDSGKLPNINEEAIRSQGYFKEIKEVYSMNRWNYSPDVIEKGNECVDIKEKNEAISNGLSGFRKSVFKDFKFSFDSERSSVMSIFDRNTSMILFNNEFSDYIFSDKNIFAPASSILVFKLLNEFKTTNISIILESEYLIIVFLKDCIKKIGEDFFYRNFSLKNIFKKESKCWKNLTLIFSSIEKVEPFYSEISVGLYNTLSKISVDVHIVFAFYKLDSRLFPFIQKEILLAINSSDLKVKVKENVFSNPEIFNVFFDLYKLCFVESTSKYKTLANVREVKFMDLND